MAGGAVMNLTLDVLKVNCGPFGDKCTRLEGGDDTQGGTQD